MSSAKAFSIDSQISRDNIVSAIIQQNLIPFGYERTFELADGDVRITDVTIEGLPAIVPIKIHYKTFEPEVTKVLSNGKEKL